MHRLYLSDRNIHTLLSKLDRRLNGEQTFCTIFKNDNTHPTYPQSMRQFCVIATDDELDFSSDARDTAGTVKLSHAALLELVKTREPVQVSGKQMFSAVMVYVIADTEYYAHREAGPMHPSDAPPFRTELH